jgi:hypothetical protein
VCLRQALNSPGRWLCKNARVRSGNGPRMRGPQIKKNPRADQRAVAVADEVKVKALLDQTSIVGAMMSSSL